MRRLVLVLLAIPLLASCSGGGGGGGGSSDSGLTTAATDSAIDTPSATPTPRPTEWTLPNAQLRFRTYTAAGANDFGKVVALYQAKSQDVAAWDKAFKVLAQDDATLAHQLHAGLWPAKAKPAIAAYESAILKRRTAYLNCAASQTMVQIFVAAKGVPDTSALEQAARVKLGLPATGK